MEKLSVQNLHISLGGKVILKGVNLGIIDGKVNAILGASGSGKSVLFKTILGINHASSGRILFNGKEIKQKIMHKRYYFGVMFQNCALFDGLSVWENIAFDYPNRLHMNYKDAKEYAIRLMIDVGLDENIADLQPKALSGGMVKRVALARAMSGNPEVLALDEPNAGLDPLMADVIDDLLMSHKNKTGTTTVIITHDMCSAIKLADNISIMKDGQVIFSGDIAAVRSSSDVYVKSFLNAHSNIHVAY